MDGRYVFKARVRLEAPRWYFPRARHRRDDGHARSRGRPTGNRGWLFFRDTLWRGEVGDDAYARELVEEWLEVPVEEVSFRELQADEAYVAALKDAIADDLEAFNAETVSEVLSKYLGSSIRVVDGGE